MTTVSMWKMINQPHREDKCSQNSIYYLIEAYFVQRHWKMLRVSLVQNVSSSFEVVRLVHSAFSEFDLNLLFSSEHSALAGA